MKKDIDMHLTALTEQEIEQQFNAKMAKKAIENSEIKKELSELFKSDETYLMEHSLDILYDIALKNRNDKDKTLIALFRMRGE